MFVSIGFGLINDKQIHAIHIDTDVTKIDRKHAKNAILLSAWGGRIGLTVDVVCHLFSMSKAYDIVWQSVKIFDISMKHDADSVCCFVSLMHHCYNVHL